MLIDARGEKGAVPEKRETATGKTVYQNPKGTVDASNAAEGYLLVSYTGGKNVRVKAQVTREKGTAYTYELSNRGAVEILPLTEGSGMYTVRIFENIGGSRYATACSYQLEVSLRHDSLPFLYANQYVNFTGDGAAAKKAAELAAGKKSDFDKMSAFYDFVVGGFSYDYELAKTVRSGYLPDVDAVLQRKKGICFDYAAVMAAMLRSQNIPCKLVIGYAGETYHAWLSVYLEGAGWVDKAIYFDGNVWKRMDPTFASTGKRSASINQYIADDANYSQKYVY